MKVQVAPSKPLGYRQITTMATVRTMANANSISGGLTNAPAGYDYAVIQAEAQVVRWTDDGTTPSATQGMRIASGGELIYAGDVSLLKFIEEAASAKLNITFYKNA